MKEERMISIIIVEQALESTHQAPCDQQPCCEAAWLEPQHLEKLKQSPAFKSALYTDALKRVH